MKATRAVPQPHIPLDRSPASDFLGAAIDRTRRWLHEQQHADGYWCGELEGDTILESETILLLAWLGREQTPLAIKAARYIQQQQLSDGGWAMYPGGAMEISGSVKAYFALKLAGHDVDAPHMRRARECIRAHGGADAVNSFTRFYLALLGQISYDHCPAVPPEAVLLPAWAPVSIYKISSWSRTILVPLSIMWAKRPVRDVQADRGIAELFLKDPDDWPPLRCPGMKQSRSLITWERTFRAIDATFKGLERFGIKPLRRRALAAAERWMLQRFEGSDGLGAIFPPIIWSVVALKCLGYDDDSDEVRYCLDELEKLVIEDSDSDPDGSSAAVRLQPCKSPVWDTAITLRGLAAAGIDESAAAIDRGIEWLLSKEVKRRGDWAQTVRAQPAGWFFEHNNEFYPDVDDTIMVMMAMAECCPELPDGAFAQRACSGIAEACERARRWILAMQNHDGGWGAFDKDNDHEFLCHVPFADHNAMIDPSTPDITARVVESLAKWGMSQEDHAVDRAVVYLRASQQADGSWPGRWGVNYIYGTWQVLVGLAEVGVAGEDPALARGADWLVAHQQPCGGWGESADSYIDAALAGKGPPTASQTAWALLGLLATGRDGDRDAIDRGIRWLLETQQADGSWHETEFTGTGFPLVFYLRYHMYPIYFPLLALSQYASSTAAETARIAGGGRESAGFSKQTT